jgi:1-deoxy-D-xylulose-5-phosphate synthase
MPQWKTPFEAIQIGKGRQIRKGSDVAILSFGPLGNFALQACELLEKQGIYAGLYDMRFAKPLDEALLHEIFSSFDKVMTLEDGCLQGGFGSAVVEFMTDNAYSSQVKRLGIADSIVEHGEPHELYQECGLDSTGIVNSVKELMAAKSIRPALY